MEGLNSANDFLDVKLTTFSFVLSFPDAVLDMVVVKALSLTAASTPFLF